MPEKAFSLAISWYFEHGKSAKTPPEGYSGKNGSGPIVVNPMFLCVIRQNKRHETPHTSLPPGTFSASPDEIAGKIHETWTRAENPKKKPGGVFDKPGSPIYDGNLTEKYGMYYVRSTPERQDR